MKNLTKRQLAIAASVTAIVAALIFIPRGNVFRDFSYDPAFNAYITAFTSRDISRQSPIIVRLSSDAVKSEQVGQPVKELPISFSPAINGTATWTDTRTIEFRPKEPLPSDTYYEASFQLGKFVQDIPENLQVFQFRFATLRQTFEVLVDGTESIDDKKLAWQKLLGSFNTADFEFSELVEQSLTATQDGKNLKIKWIHSEDGNTHSFTVDSVSRKPDPSEVVLNWDGGPMGLDLSGNRNVAIPAQGEFYALSAHTFNDPEQYLEINFSDPLKPGQDLRGLITIGEHPLKFVIQGSKVKVYPSNRLAGTHTLRVETGVRNVLNHKLQKANQWDITFEALKPALRLYSSGNILPRGGVLPFVFEAVSLKSVNVNITKIYENNVLQFLQVNDLGGDNELHRVGKSIIDTTLAIDGNKHMDLHQWNRHVIDLSKLINSEPGAIYNVTLSFTREHSIYQCEGQGQANAENENENNEEGGEEEGEEYEEYYEDDYQDYWSNRDNPCHEAYYSYYYNSRSVSRNILASDLGMLAKGGTEGTLLLFVTDLKTTAPMANVALEVYDYQRQLLKRMMTDANGMASVSLTDKPFVVIAKQGNQRGYLKLDDGYSLSLSKFDISGESYHQGIKGFIYGERGVWRPGDSLFLSFILQDENKSLPDDHPVTFTLTNPKGQIIKKIIKKEHTHGVYTFVASTNDNAITGNYQATVNVGGAIFSKTLKVETVMPNRLKINLNFPKEYLTPSKGEAGSSTELSSQWLHGAIARNLKARVSVALSGTKTKFKKYAEYTFDDPVRKFQTEDLEIFDGSLDQDGKATVSLSLDPETEAPGMLMANFTTKVFEPGGNFSVDYVSIPFYPYERFVGVKAPKGEWGMLYNDTQHPIDIAVVDPAGNPAGNDSVTLTLYELSWQWWWDQSYENVTSYNGKFYNQEVKKTRVAIRNGAGRWNLKMPEGTWGRHLIRVEDAKGHITGKIVYLGDRYWYNSANSEITETATLLNFSTDKTKYAVGETVTLTIPMGKQGRALVSIESGSRVIRTEWMDAKAGLNTYKFVTTAEMAPNVYAHVSLIQPHSQTSNDLPMRLYGVVPVEVFDPLTKLNPVITTAATFRPEEKATIKVSESAGKKMVYTLAVVDEGLLDLTRFKTPDPWNSFYAREALDVKTWDLFDHVIGAYTGDLSRLLSVGGDGTAAAKGGAKVNRFRPVVKFLGPFILQPGQTNTHSFMMPNYVGSVKAMVVARWEDAYGNAEKQVPVRKPLMVLGTLPRVVGPGEEIQLPVTVFAMEKNVKNVSVKVETNDFFTLTGGAQKSATFTTTGDQVVNFSMKVKEKAGTGTVKITATSGSEVSVYHVDVDVRLSNPPVTQTEFGEVAASQSWKQTINWPGVQGTNKGSIEVSTNPPVNLGQRLTYLIQYPHGCIEQTTSSVFPQVYLTLLMELNEQKKKEVDKNINAGISRLQSFQTPGGGLSYWPGENEPSDWGTNYAGAFVIEAKKRGYNIPTDFLSKWISYQTSRARTWSSTSGYYDHPHGHESHMLIQADRLYLLALAGSPELGSMNRLRETPGLEGVSKWRLAAAYKLAGQGETAAQLVRGLSDEVAKYRELSYSYGSDLRDMALILESMAVMGMRDKGNALARRISDRLCSDYWYSTQETGYSLVAIAKFFNVTGTGGNPVNITYRVGGGEWVNLKSSKSMASIDLKAGNSPSVSVEIKNNTGVKLYTRVTTTGVPVEGREAAFSNDLGLEVKFTDTDGNTLNPASISQGTDFYVEITVKNVKDRYHLEELALTTIFPSGWEILNSRMGGANFNTTADYVDFRDDRIYTYFDLTHRRGWYKEKLNEITFKYQANASYLGKFYLPMWKVEAMYDESLSAGTQGMWVNVVPSGENQ